MTRAVLSAEKVTHQYGDVTTLHELDLQVPQGEFLVILGPSGCGKSTLLNLFAGFQRPASGRVLLHGEEIIDVEPRCGMVFQDYALFPWLSVKRNISFGPRLRGQVDARRIDDLRSIVGIEGFGDHYPSPLSGGMKQRVALARRLANDPEVLLCDEPFGAVDAMTRQVLQEELSRIASAENKTVVFITHSIDEAILLADRIVVLSARPSRIKTSIANDLPRPRTRHMLHSRECQRLKDELWDSVKDEVVAAMRH